jgi:tRNA(Ile)-lysidine synthase
MDPFCCLSRSIVILGAIALDRQRPRSDSKPSPSREGDRLSEDSGDLDDGFLRKLDAQLAGYSKTSRAIVGVSGGCDSVALLRGLIALGWHRLTVAHLDHTLRGRASQGDAKFVQRMAAKLGLRYVGGRAEVRDYAAERGLSIEHAARELRHVFFAGVARRERCRTVFLAHHADDQVETCLFNFLRGSGAAGLAGMRPESIQKLGAIELRLIRPMLGIRRREIEAFLRGREIPWREDASNRSPEHTRNRLRERVLPVLAQEFGPSFPGAILRAAEILAAEDDWMRAEAERVPLGPEISVRELGTQPLALRRRVVRRWLESCGIAEAGFVEVERVLSLLDATGGPAKVNLPGDRHARRRQGKIFLDPS